MHDKEHIKALQLKHFEEFNNRIGILNLTANPCSAPMWVKYSGSHHGFCVGFNTKEMFKYLGGGAAVEYYETLPQIMPSASDKEEIFTQLLSKEKKWEFEEEYRTWHFSYSPLSNQERRVVIPSGCYSKVIFGALKPEVHKKEIIADCKAQNLDVVFYNAEIDESEGNINIISA